MSKTNKYIVFIAGLALLIIEFFAMDYSDFWVWRNFKGMAIPFLIIILMFAAIMKSRPKNDKSYN